MHVWLLILGWLFLSFVFTSNVDYLLMSFVGAYAVATLGLALIFGLGGMLSVAQAALVGIGAYTSALLMLKAHWPFLLTAVCGVIVASLISAVFTLLAGRARSHYFVLVSFAVAEIFILVDQGTSFAGGSQGLGGIPPMSFAGHAASTPRPEAFIALVLLIIGWYLADVFKACRLGRAVLSADLNEELARTCGINVLVSRLAVSAVGGGFAGAAGVVLASTINYLDPATLSLDLALLFLVSAVVGGMGSIAWTVAASVLFTYLNNGTSNLTTTGPLIYGVVVVVVLLIAPGGVAGLAERGSDAAKGLCQRIRSRRSGTVEGGRQL